MLGIAWDARPWEQGGQRWFDLYPNQNLKADDALHWSGREQNWNFMCASCHTTGLRKNYDLATDTFNTRWSDINVACESCHGPGSAHVANPSKQMRSSGTGINWRFDTTQQRIASAHGDMATAKSASENCFACHARRQQLTPTPDSGKTFLDNYLPSLIEHGLYHADGQIDDEVFEFGSFAQSKMLRAGVTCTNCHEAHSLKLKATGNALCEQCHRAADYDNTEHTHHPLGSTGGQCINCHMPKKTYMGVDERHDHSFRIPSPDLSTKFDTPNACTQCHADRSSAWAADAIAGWTGKQPDTLSDFAAGINAAWLSSAAADRLLTTLSTKPEMSAIVRASALSHLSGPLRKQTRQAINDAVRDPDALVRLGAARALAILDDEQRVSIGAPLLSDPIRAVRIETARALAGTQDKLFNAIQKQQLKVATDELIRAERAAAERPESHVNLAQVYARLGRAKDAERELKTALRLDARFVPAMVNLADLYRDLNRDAEGERWLRKAINITPAQAEPAHALGLYEIRHRRRTAALPWLEKAVALAPQDSGYAFVYALALAENSDASQSLDVIEKARQHSPENASLLQLQITIERRLGRLNAVSEHEAELSGLTADLRQELP